ncbi:MAG TPA: arylsulfotransferase family protein [Gaiellaceae bacterium]|nr:arylsulfotransferase family protein [Gaiellaceae bacterium]
MAGQSSKPLSTDRRGFVAASAGLLAALAVPRLGSAEAQEPDEPFAWSFRSRPDLAPPTITVETAAPTVAPGYMFLAPFQGPGQHGPLIVDDAGRPVWFKPLESELAHNFRVQKLGGQPVLTWWEGKAVNGFYEGECVIADGSYRIVNRLAGANGLHPEVHEFVITSRDTALISANDFVPADLSAYGGPANGTMVEGVVLEIDISSGEVLLEWHSLHHIAPDESYVAADAATVWDYLHLNSIGVDQDDNLLVSCRHTWAVYKLHRESGEIIWRLGGKNNDFQLGPGASFAYQHDARGHPGGVLSIFDDGAYSTTVSVESITRAILLVLDVDAMTAELAQAFPNPRGSLSWALGNMQLQEHGGPFVSWGTTPEITEFAPDGSVVFDAQFTGGAISYRGFRDVWVGSPAEPPAVFTSGNADGTLEVCMSWNGATKVSHWQVLGGSDPSHLHVLRTVPRAGFETVVQLPAPVESVGAAALDTDGNVLGRSPTRSI